MAAELRPFIQKENVVVRQRHFARHGHLAAPDQPRVRHRLMGGATRAGRDQGRAIAGAAGDAMDAGGFNGLCQRQHRQTGAQARSR